MAHWAELDENNIVIRVLTTDNDMSNEGYDFLIETFGGKWIQTSYNAKQNGFRKNFAGLGYFYDEALDAFIPPKPFPDYIWDESIFAWKQPPIIEDEPAND